MNMGEKTDEIEIVQNYILRNGKLYSEVEKTLK